MKNEVTKTNNSTGYSFLIKSESWNIYSRPMSIGSDKNEDMESNQSKYLRNFLKLRGSDSSQKISYERLIDRLINFNYQLKKPIKVRVEFIDNELFGYIEELGIYAYADNDFDLLREINEDLSDLFNMIVDNPKYKLGKKPRQWKKILTKYIEKV